jgi:hypothetical protein
MAYRSLDESTVTAYIKERPFSQFSPFTKRS